MTPTLILAGASAVGAASAFFSSLQAVNANTEASVATPSNFFKFIKDPLLMLMLSELTMIDAFC